MLKKEESNQGDDIAGMVHAVGSNVVEFRKETVLLLPIK